MSAEDQNPVESVGTWGAEPAPEAKAEPEAPVEADEPSPEVNDEAKPLELTEDDELAPDDEDEKGEHKGRSKSAKQRIDELTKARREAERRVAELEAQLAGKPIPEQPEEIGEAPDPDKYEFGEADPQFIKDTIQHGVKAALAEEKAKESAKAQQAAATETLATLDNSWAEQEAAGAEKYDDFAEVVETFKAEAPCPPLMAVAIQASPVGADVVHHLGRNIDEAELIAAELEVNPVSAAERFGYIEGQYLDTKPERPPHDAHPLDKALYTGRLKAFIENKGKKVEEKPAAKIATDAPDPPKKQVRGGAGSFKANPDTDDMSAFERDFGKELGLR